MLVAKLGKLKHTSKRHNQLVGADTLEFCQRGVDLESFADRFAAVRADIVIAQVELYERRQSVRAMHTASVSQSGTWACL